MVQHISSLLRTPVRIPLDGRITEPIQHIQTCQLKQLRREGREPVARQVQVLERSGQAAQVLRKLSVRDEVISDGQVSEAGQLGAERLGDECEAVVAEIKFGQIPEVRDWFRQKFQAVVAQNELFDLADSEKARKCLNNNEKNE